VGPSALLVIFYLRKGRLEEVDTMVLDVGIDEELLHEVACCLHIALGNALHHSLGIKLLTARLLLGYLEEVNASVALYGMLRELSLLGGCYCA